MTKVKQTNARKNGKASVVSSAMNSSSDRKIISAERNGETRNFPVNIWNHLPEDKEGWKESQGKPADIDTSNSKKGDKPSDEDKEVIARYKKLFGKDADESLDVSVMARLSDELEAEQATAAKQKEGMVDFVVDQEFLDTNPERAKEGLKVGEVIQIEKGGAE